MARGIKSCCYFPTTVLLIDKNLKFLKQLSASLSSQFHFRLCTDFQKALLHLESEPLLSKVIEQCFSLCADLEKDVHKSSRDIYLSSLHHLVYDGQRYNEVSVIVIDSAMPGSSSLDFCRALKNHPAKKIMLTTEADHGLAVEAFNEGVIDRFILKQVDESKLHQQLNVAIYDMMESYFLSACTRLQMGVNLSNLWKAPSFQALYGEICSLHDICEYYLLNSKGSMLLMDSNGSYYWLIIEENASLEAYVQMAQDNNASIDVVSALVKRQKIPFFFGPNQKSIDFEYWSNILYPAEKLDQSGLYFSFLKSDQMGHLYAEKISHYKSFIENEELAISS